MAVRTPAWWYRKDAKGAPWWRPVLWPLSRAWLAVNAAKAKNARPYRSSLKVISVGNVTLGGSGKTPVTAEILRLLGDTAAGLSRGHGGSLQGPVKVDPARDAAAEVGDESLMLAQYHPFWIARNRAEGLRAMEDQAAIAVVDDAHQNLTIVKDVHLLVVDGDTKDGAWPFGDGGIFPHGPLREPLEQGLARADMVVVWMPDQAPPAPDLLALFAGKPVFVARLEAIRPEVDGPVFAFAGIAKPWKFRATLESHGVTLAGFAAFPDHHGFTAAELSALDDKAGGATLITTEKDWVRLPQAWRERVRCLPICARFDDEAGLLAALKRALM